MKSTRLGLGCLLTLAMLVVFSHGPAFAQGGAVTTSISGVVVDSYPLDLRPVATCSSPA